MIEKPISRLIQTLEARSFSLIGSPGACGLGVDALQTYGSAIRAAAGDFLVTLGGVSPLGRDPFYRTVADFIDTSSPKPMYVVPGAGDGEAFSSYFGHRDKAVITEDFFLILLDNSGGTFSDASLSFLRDTLAIAEMPNIIVAFHYPPPNRFSGNSMGQAEWARFGEAAGVWRKRITLLVAGNSDMYFEDEVDGLRLICSGGGAVHTGIPDRSAETVMRLVEFRLDDSGTIAHESKQVRSINKMQRPEEIAGFLDAAFTAECQAHACHLLNAEEAERRGMANLAKLFRATAESRFRHAKSLRRALHGAGTTADLIETVISPAGPEESSLRLERADAAQANNDAIAQRVFQDLAASEIVNSSLLERANDILAGAHDIDPNEYQVCSSCGVVFAGFRPPDHCSECGAPMELIREIH